MTLILLVWLKGFSITVPEEIHIYMIELHEIDQSTILSASDYIAWSSMIMVSGVNPIPGIRCFAPKYLKSTTYTFTL